MTKVAARRVAKHLLVASIYTVIASVGLGTLLGVGAHDGPAIVIYAAEFVAIGMTVAAALLLLLSVFLSNPKR